MVKCKECKQEMIGSNSCTHKLIKLGGKWFARDSTYFDIGKVCHDCGIKNIPGNVHHFGCDVERCPKCRQQLISCGCCTDDNVEFAKGFSNKSSNSSGISSFLTGGRK